MKKHIIYEIPESIFGQNFEQAYMQKYFHLNETAIYSLMRDYSMRMPCLPCSLVLS